MKQCMSFTKGMGLGIVVGIAAVASHKCYCRKNKKFRHKTAKAAKAMSDIMDDIQALLN